MAIFNEINKRSGLVVGTVIVALVLFLLTDFLFGQNSLFNRNDNKVGEIAGEKISTDEFQQQMQIAEGEFAITRNASPKESDRPMIQESAWNQLLFEYAYKGQFDKLGLTVTEEEWLDLAKGNHIHPMVQQLFGPSFSKEMVNNFIDNLAQAQPQHQQLWHYVDSKLPEIRIREKYSNLFKKTEYVTTAEAKREYVAQTQKADAKYLSVPFASIPDSTVKPTDSELKDYISKNAEKYKVEAGRSLDYVIFTVVPSAQDSAQIAQEMAELAKDFAAADNDSAFAQANSEYSVPVAFKRPGNGPNDLSPEFDVTGTPDSNKVYGPYYHNGAYKLYKILGTKADTIASARASHILIKDKAKADSVLAAIKAGASFEEMAKKFGSDATADKGGDLGWFGQQAMVKPFSDAVFNASSKGLLPNLVETQFGFHIIKVTAPKTSRLYKVVEVNKNIGFSEETKDMVYNKATEFKNGIKDSAAFYAKIKADKSLKLDSARNIGQNDRNLTGLDNAREVIRWAFTKADPGDISEEVFQVNDKFVVALLKDAREKGLADVKDVRADVTAKVIQEKKATQIIEKLAALNGSLEEIAKKYGQGATTGTAEGVSLQSPFIQGVGYDPAAVGRLFGLKEGKKTAPFEGQTGAVILELTKTVPAPEVGDYTVYKTQLQQQRGGSSEYLINEAIKEKAEIEDDRYKFF